jgi:hypothetical protein
MRITALLLAAAVILTPTLASAQNRIQCYDRVEGNGPGEMAPGMNNTFLNMAMTDRYRAAQIAQDPQVMAAFAGVWGGQSQAMGMVDTTYYSFEPNGLFQYQSQTCTPGLSCSQNYGTGEWTAHAMNDGSIEVMFAWSDLVRTQACSAMVGFVQGAVFQTGTGFALQRMQ